MIRALPWPSVKLSFLACAAPMPWYATVALGLGGSMIGGIIARLLVGTAGGFVFAFLGAVVLLYLYRRFVQHRGITGPSARLPPRV